MFSPRLFLVLLLILLASPATAQDANSWRSGCRADEPGRSVAKLKGQVNAGKRYHRNFGPSFTFSLEPIETGWIVSVQYRGRAEDIARLTPPWHFVPNPRYIEGWHFRNQDNTGPNEGSVNAPQGVREFVFSPEVGQSIDGPKATAQPTAEEMKRVFEFGSGELRILDYSLSDLEPGKRARMVRLKFQVCVSWPKDFKGEGVR